MRLLGRVRLGGVEEMGGSTRDAGGLADQIDGAVGNVGLDYSSGSWTTGTVGSCSSAFVMALAERDQASPRTSLAVTISATSSAAALPIRSGA